MPREYNLIQRPDLQQRLSRGLDIVGESSPARTLDPTVQAVVLLEDLTKQGSPFVQPVDRRGLACFPLAADAANRSLVLIRNPTDSGLVVVVDGLMISTSQGSSDIGIGRYSPALAVIASNGAYADTRNGVQSPVQVMTANPAATQVLVEMARVRVGTSGAGQSQFHIPSVVCLPGETFGIESTVINAALSGSFSWLEYTP